jgi:hypothetical protein
MPNMNQAKIDAQYIMMVGTPGTRKSTQALSYPGPQYWFSYDQKMNSLLLPMKHWKIDPKTIEYDDYSDWDLGRKKLESLQVNCPYKTIIVDSGTICANAILRQTKLLKTGKTRASGANAGKSVAGIAVNEIEDYNAESAALLELVALTKDICKFHHVNVILIWHLIQAEYKTSPNSEANVVRTIVTAGKRVAPMIPAYCEEVYHFFMDKAFTEGEGKYSILTSSTNEDFARTQLPLARKIEVNDKPLYTTWIKPAIEELNKGVA